MVVFVTTRVTNTKEPNSYANGIANFALYKFVGAIQKNSKVSNKLKINSHAFPHS